MWRLRSVALSELSGCFFFSSTWLNLFISALRMKIKGRGGWSGWECSSCHVSGAERSVRAECPGGGYPRGVRRHPCLPCLAVRAETGVLLPPQLCCDRGAGGSSGIPPRRPSLLLPCPRPSSPAGTSSSAHTPARCSPGAALGTRLFLHFQVFPFHIATEDVSLDVLFTWIE